VAVAIIWFTDKDREDMRREKEQRIERDMLFFEFLREENPFRVASRELSPVDFDKMARLDIRPWPDRSDDQP
jgi:hypothetical protein